MQKKKKSGLLKRIETWGERKHNFYQDHFKFSGKLLKEKRKGTWRGGHEKGDQR